LSTTAKISSHFHSKFIQNRCGRDQDWKRAFLSTKCLFVSFCSPLFTQSLQHYYLASLKPLMVLYVQKQIVSKSQNVVLILILYFFPSLILYMIISNRTVHIWHRYWKPIVLSCHWCLINTGVEKIYIFATFNTTTLSLCWVSNFTYCYAESHYSGCRSAVLTNLNDRKIFVKCFVNICR
jgi:hypothetical protein